MPRYTAMITALNTMLDKKILGDVLGMLAHHGVIERTMHDIIRTEIVDLTMSEEDEDEPMLPRDKSPETRDLARVRQSPVVQPRSPAPPRSRSRSISGREDSDTDEEPPGSPIPPPPRSPSISGCEDSDPEDDDDKRKRMPETVVKMRAVLNKIMTRGEWVDVTKVWKRIPEDHQYLWKFKPKVFGAFLRKQTESGKKRQWLRKRTRYRKTQMSLACLNHKDFENADQGSTVRAHQRFVSLPEHQADTIDKVDNFTNLKIEVPHEHTRIPQCCHTVLLSLSLSLVLTHTRSLSPYLSRTRPRARTHTQALLAYLLHDKTVEVRIAPASEQGQQGRQRRHDEHLFPENWVLHSSLPGPGSDHGCSKIMLTWQVIFRESVLLSDLDRYKTQIGGADLLYWCQSQGNPSVRVNLYDIVPGSLKKISLSKKHVTP